MIQSQLRLIARVCKCRKENLYARFVLPQIGGASLEDRGIHLQLLIKLSKATGRSVWLSTIEKSNGFVDLLPNIKSLRDEIGISRLLNTSEHLSALCRDVSFFPVEIVMEHV